MNCRTCAHGYIRSERTKTWNYEACALGMITMMFFINEYCECYDPATPEQMAVRIDHKPSIIWGEDIILD